MSEPTGRSTDGEPEAGWVISLGDARDVDVVGVKGATLGALLRAGFAVPSGFVISAAAFAHAATARSVTPRLREAVALALRRFPETALAVRSSSVAEHLPDTAHAGLYETTLDVRGGPAVIAAVEHCWASAASAGVAAYLAKRATRASPRASGGGEDAADGGGGAADGAGVRIGRGVHRRPGHRRSRRGSGERDQGVGRAPGVDGRRCRRVGGARRPRHTAARSRTVAQRRAGARRG